MKSRLVRIFFACYALCVGAAVAALVWINLGLHHMPGLERPPNGGVIDRDLLKGLRYLEHRGMERIAAEMQSEYPEGFVFAWGLYGLAWSRIAADAGNDTPLYAHAMGQARAARRAIDSEEGRSIFSPALSPPYGAFYNGWRNLLLGGIIAARREKNRAEDSLFTAGCDLIAQALRDSPTPFLSSYPGLAWPADAVVAVASLARHDRLSPPRYADVLRRWRSDVRRLLDPATGLIPHAVRSADGSLRQGARGSSQSLMLCLLPSIDPDFAAEQYQIYRRRFFTTWFGLPAVREYPHGTEGEGDVDSGPVLFGVGAAASVVGIGAMRANGDGARAEQQRQTVDALGFPWSAGEERRYFFGALPMGDIFLAWGRSLPLKQEEERIAEAEFGALSSSSTMRKLPLSLFSLFFPLLLFLPFFVLYNRRRKGEKSQEKKAPPKA